MLVKKKVSTLDRCETQYRGVNYFARRMTKVSYEYIYKIL